MHGTLFRAGVPALLALACGSASAGVTSLDGVDFSATRDGNTLTLQIDAAHPTGGWTNATQIGALEIHDIGQFTGVTLGSPNLPGVSTWALSAAQLGAGGCSGGVQPGRVACFSGAHIGLASGMLFTFTFTGDTVDLEDPSVKVNFFATGGTRKLGSLFSDDVVADPVKPPPRDLPEPQPAALLLAGVGILAVVKRKR